MVRISQQSEQLLSQNDALVEPSVDNVDQPSFGVGGVDPQNSREGNGCRDDRGLLESIRYEEGYQQGYPAQRGMWRPLSPGPRTSVDV